MIVYIISAIIILLLLAAVLVAVRIFDTTFVRSDITEEVQNGFYDRVAKQYSAGTVEQMKAGVAWISAREHEDVYITSRDGFKLHAEYHDNGGDKTIVLCHGFHGSGYNDFCAAFEFYASRGLNFLIIDERAHGKSEGKYLTFGVMERFDICDWCKYTDARFPGRKLILGGISMGCISALLAAALPDMPATLCGIVADCGLVSPEREFSYIARHNMHLPPFPMVRLLDLVCRVKGRFSFYGISTLDAVKKITVPILFVHGEDDDFVLPDNTADNFNASISQGKRLLTVPKAGHGMSFLVDCERCKKELDEFIGAL